jgi:hypothetical protein
MTPGRLEDECHLGEFVNDYVHGGAPPPIYAPEPPPSDAFPLASAVLQRTLRPPRRRKPNKNTRSALKRSAATQFLGSLCGAHEARNASAHTCVRYPLTSVDLDRAGPGTAAFDDAMLQMCRWPAAWPLCALNMGARVLASFRDKASFRRYFASLTNVSTDFAEAICTDAAMAPSACAAPECAEARKLRARFDASRNATANATFGCFPIHVTQDFLDACASTSW